MGRTPWSARVPLDPLLDAVAGAKAPTRPARASAPDFRLPTPKSGRDFKAEALAYALTATLIWRGLAASFLGRVTLRTPFL